MHYFAEKIYCHPELFCRLTNNVQVYPHMIELSPTSECNLNCCWCVDKDIRLKHQHSMDIGQLKCKLEEYRNLGTRTVVLEGGGEPLLYPDFDELVRYLHGKGWKIGLITNGTLVRESMALCHWIRVSLDADHQKRYLALKGKDEYDRVIGNIKKMRRVCPTVGVSYIVTIDNTEFVDQVIQELAPCVDFFQFKTITECPELFVPIEKLEWILKYQTDYLRIYLVDCKPGNAAIGCLAHAVTSTIAPDGTVYFCKRLKANPNAPDSIIGNIFEQSVAEIYEGQGRRTLNEQVKDGGFCRQHCPACRLTKYNLLLAKGIPGTIDFF